MTEQSKPTTDDDAVQNMCAVLISTLWLVHDQGKRDIIARWLKDMPALAQSRQARPPVVPEKRGRGRPRKPPNGNKTKAAPATAIAAE